MIRAESFGFAAGPDLHTSVTNHYQLEIFRSDLTERIPKVIGRAFQPVEKDIDTNQLFLGIGSLFNNRLAKNFLDVFLFVGDGLQGLRFLAQAIDYGLRKFFGPYFLLARAFVVDIVSMNSVFNRAQPGVMDFFRAARLSYMDQHHNRA